MAMSAVADLRNSASCLSIHAATNDITGVILHSYTTTQPTRRRGVKGTAAFNKNLVKVAKRNARERNRVSNVNRGFLRLQQVVPQTQGKERKPSKVDTLRAAIAYIRYLDDLLQHPGIPSNGPPNNADIFGDSNDGLCYNAWQPFQRQENLRAEKREIISPLAIDENQLPGFNSPFLVPVAMPDTCKTYQASATNASDMGNVTSSIEVSASLASNDLYRTTEKAENYCLDDTIYTRPDYDTVMYQRKVMPLSRANNGGKFYSKQPVETYEGVASAAVYHFC